MVVYARVFFVLEAAAFAASDLLALLNYMLTCERVCARVCTFVHACACVLVCTSKLSTHAALLEDEKCS